MIPMDVRRRVVERAREIMVAHWPTLEDSPGACLYLTWATVRALAEEGIGSVMLAGSATWPRLRPDQDDGVSMTHFGYVWDLNSDDTRLTLAVGEAFPELHVWAGIPETGEYVDLTAGSFPAQCLALIGMDWPGDLPPEYLWARPDQFPEGVMYAPTRDGGDVALGYLRRALGHG